MEKNFIKTRIPINNNYATMLGKAIYAFAYYEWIIIYIIAFFEKDFIQKYSREQVMTSGQTYKKFEEILDTQQIIKNKKYLSILRDCKKKFVSLTIERNALIHAHPITDTDNYDSQILSYQTKLSKPISDKKWTERNIELFINDIDASAVKASEILETLKTY